MNEYIWALLWLILTTVIAAVGRALFEWTDVAMLYLAMIMLVATRFGQRASIFTAALSVAAYDFFFVPPYLTFNVADSRHILTFAMMFGIGILVSTLTLRIRRQEEEAKAALLKARAEEMRSSLLSAVSHDLRTPLAAITGAATTLRDESGASLSVSQRQDLLEAICEEAERLERLVANLLDMTRLESGGLPVRREWIPLEELVGSALTRLEKQLAGREIKTDLPGNLPLLSVDPVLFEQVLLNLLENASKHTPAQRPIEIQAHIDAQWVIIEIADRGPGIPAGLEQRIFEKFFRASPSGPAGVGLGLAICRGIVEAHGGTLRAENRPGGGAVFRVALPAGAQAPEMPSEEPGN
ncbi:MAG TPA: ATP-binding protein [Polyangiaceae bacterium]|nr:ATP-binding protein [Polyangiaceae bacterium]